MTKRTILAALAVVAACGAGSAALSFRQAVAADDWRGVTLLYQSDVKGKIEPCG